MSGLGPGWNVSAEWPLHGSHLQGELWRVWLLVRNKFGNFLYFLKLFSPSF